MRRPEAARQPEAVKRLPRRMTLLILWSLSRLPSTAAAAAEQQDAIGKNWGNVDDYCQEMILKYIVGSSDISEWDSLVNTIKGMEIDKVLAAKQEAYDDYLQRVEELKK